MLAEEEDGLGEGDEDTPLGPDEGGDADDVTAAGASCRGVVEWLIEFSPKSFKDVKNVIEGRAGIDANRHWRQGSSYWEMISALMMRV